MAQSITLRFADQPSHMETTYARLEIIASHMGVSMNKAAGLAINQLYQRLVTPTEQEDQALEQTFAQAGVTLGGVTFLGASPEFIAQGKAREAEGLALPHLSDDDLERHLLFAMLTPPRQAQVREVTTMAEKRRLLLALAQEQAQLGAAPAA